MKARVLAPAGFSSRSPFARLFMKRITSAKRFALKLPDGTCALVEAGLVVDVWNVGERPPLQRSDPTRRPA